LPGENRKRLTLGQLDANDPSGVIDRRDIQPNRMVISFTCAGGLMVTSAAKLLR
jgi:hypothetical protein